MRDIRPKFKHVKFMYLRDEKGVPRVTVAYAVSGIDRVQYAVATQNVEKDSWNSKIGRAHAEGRLNSCRDFWWASVSPEKLHSNFEQMQAIVKSIKDTPCLSDMTRACADVWLTSPKPRKAKKKKQAESAV